MSMTNELVFGVWQKGFIEVAMNPDATWVIKPNEKTGQYLEYQDELSPEEWLLMMEINRMIFENKI